MLIAKSRMIVGAMKIQATIRSDSPRTRLARVFGVARAAASAARSSIDEVVSVTTGFPLGKSCMSEVLRPAPPYMARDGLGRRRLHLPVVLEHFGPVGHEAVESFLGGALAGHHVVMETLLR